MFSNVSYNRDNRTDNFNRNPDSNNYNRSSMNPRPQFNRNDYSRQNSGGPRGPPQFNNRPRHQGPQIRPIRNHNNVYQPRGGAGQLPNRAPIPRTQPRLASPRFPVRNMQPGTQFQVPPQVHMHRTYSAFNNFGPTTSAWSFLKIFRIIFGQNIEIFQIAQRERARRSSRQGNFENFYFLAENYSENLQK